MTRKSTAVDMFTVMIGWCTVSWSTSSTRDLPQPFVGPTTARRGACCRAVWMCVAATHRVTAVSASSLGSTTYLPIAARNSSSSSAPSPEPRFPGSAGPRGGREPVP